MPGIAVLGPVRLIDGEGKSVAVGSRRQCVLLAVLVRRLGRAVSADELVEALWGDALPDHPVAALQSRVFRLRRQLAAAEVGLDTDGSGYRLAVGRDLVDAARFEDLLAGASAWPGSGEPTTAIGLVDEALALWRGRPYLEVADHHAVLGEASRLEELHAGATELRAEVLLQLGEAAEAACSMEALMGVRGSARRHATPACTSCARAAPGQWWAPAPRPGRERFAVRAQRQFTTPGHALPQAPCDAVRSMTP